MNALIDYMNWLTAEAAARKLPTPESPFPDIARLDGHPGRGRRIFLQKCAFCHGADGEGRYESGEYYRPALWGTHSFNSAAGLHKNRTLAAFLHANMTYGSRGELTEQEAWDLSVLVNSHSRPAGPPKPVPAWSRESPKANGGR